MCFNDRKSSKTYNKYLSYIQVKNLHNEISNFER